MFETNLMLYIYSNILLISVLIASSGSNKINTSDRLFNLGLFTTIWMLFFDLISRFDGLAFGFYPFFNHVGNFFLFLFNPMVGIIWFLYIHYEIFSNDKSIKKFTLVLLPVFLVNMVLVVGSQFFGWLYYIDELNIYHRGPLYMIPELMNIIIILITFIMLTIEKKRFPLSHYLTYLTFGLFPIAGLIAQSISYGISYTLNAIAISIVIIYVSVQNKRMKRDYLTNTFNRRQLDYYLEDQIKRAQKNHSFSAIFVDIDDFKLINDTFGHPVGDEALVRTVEVIKSCIKSSDFLARFGGDEFFIVSNLFESEKIEQLILDINERFNAFNELSQNFRLKISIGYCVYNKELHPTLEEFQKDLDRLLYESKLTK